MGVGPSGRPEDVSIPAEETPEPAAPVGGTRTPIPTSPDLVADSVLSRPLQELMQRVPDRPIGIVVELRTLPTGGLDAAADRVRHLAHLLRPDTPVQLNGSYLTTALRADEITRLVAGDAASERADRTSTKPAPRGAIHRIWPNFEIRALTVQSVITTKCRAAHRAFDATGRGIVWAVLDSGIDQQHAHFHRHENLKGLQHKSFLPGPDQDPLSDDAGHGTHVAAILAGEQSNSQDEPPLLAASWYHDDAEGETRAGELPLQTISGMAPQCRLLSCKVLRGDESGDITALLAALRYIQLLNDNGRHLQVHGVNISVGHAFDPSWFAAGRTPVCREVDRLVHSGVVVVVAAGNTGYGYARDPAGRAMRLGFDTTINDPGNAQLGITVGSTSSEPHLSGVSYFSSKGPTGDGRMKPDLVAPGERIISAAAGELLSKAQQKVPKATYVENSGTSMSAPHVSGAAAALLSVHREFIGRPDEVKRTLLSSATDLGRSPHFQGAGLVDTMRAIQSV